MIADWGKYSSFGFPLKNENHANEVAYKLKEFLYNYN